MKEEKGKERENKDMVGGWRLRKLRGREDDVAYLWKERHAGTHAHTRTNASTMKQRKWIFVGPGKLKFGLLSSFKQISEPEQRGILKKIDRGIKKGNEHSWVTEAKTTPKKPE